MQLQRLLKLYGSSSNPQRTPLEDFTTEAFAGILESNQEIFDQFTFNFLGLEPDQYTILTQKKYSLLNDTDCIIDMVIRSSNTICFIENKVNSVEGYRQLERYTRVLEYLAAEDIKTKLCYCTKYTDDKAEIEQSFYQYRWYHIARFLKPFGNDSLVNEFLQFLAKHNMAQETTLQTTDFLVIENCKDTFSKINDLLDLVKPSFQEHFCKVNKISDGKSFYQIFNHDRYINYVKDFVKGDSWSEIKYGLMIEGPKIYVNIYLDSKNEHHDHIVDLAKESGKFEFTNYSTGTSIKVVSDISHFLNNESIDGEIKTWFESQFKLFETFVDKCGREKFNI